MTEKKTGTRSIVRPPSMAMPSEKTSQFHVGETSHDPFDDGKKTKLKLDYDVQKPAKTRQQLYNEMKQEEVILDQDIYQYASVLERGIALALDFVFLFILFKAIVFFVPLELKLAELFMARYKVEFILGNALLSKFFFGANVVVAIFSGIVFPMAFFNSSFGKKFLGLKVRGDEKYTLTITEAFLREVVMKPIGMGCLIGFVLPFFGGKDRKSLHDKVMHTFVIKV